MIKFVFIKSIILCFSVSFSNASQLFSHHNQDTLDTSLTESISETSCMDSLLFANLEGYGIDSQSIECYPLYTKISEWIGTPYHYGGNSKKGIDCSRLVIELTNSIYYDSINGSSATLYRESQKLNKNQLYEGDLVFFKINSSSVSHVGVYLQDDLFVHATRSKGVIISSLNESYYIKYFYKGGRIID